MNQILIKIARLAAIYAPLITVLILTGHPIWASFAWVFGMLSFWNTKK